MKKIIPALLLCFLPIQARAQTPAPVSNTLNFQIGAAAFGLGGTSQATPASDIVITLNPGFQSKFWKNLWLRDDSMLAPGANLQLYAPGFRYTLPLQFPSTSIFGSLHFYVYGVAGIDRIVPATGPSKSHFAWMAGAGVDKDLGGGVTVNIFEAGALHTPGAPWGPTTSAIAGGLTKVFGGSSQ